MKTRHLITLLLLSTVLLIQNAQSVQVSSQSQAKPHKQSTEPDTTTASTFNQTVEPLQFPNWPAWNSYISNTPAPGAGCFEATYPNTVWQARTCGTASPIPLRASPATIGGASPMAVGNGNDEVAYSSGTLIGSSFGSFQSIAGLTSEIDSKYGTNEFGLQVNAQFFATSSTPYTSNQQLTCVSPTYVCGWEQFVFINDPSGVYGTQIFIQYWLTNYYTNYGYCPGTAPPGGGFNGQPWYDDGGSCVSNSPNYPSLPTQTASNLANLILKGYANFGSGSASCTTACDEVVFCYSGGSCYAVAIMDQVVDLYQHWQYSEFNVFGLGSTSEANFNTGTTITVVNTLKDQSGNLIAPSCVNTGFTGETNNLNLGSCSSPGNGQIIFTESNAPSQYSATFAEFGIPSGINWGVTVSGTHYSTSSGTSIQLSGLTGVVSYSYDSSVAGSGGSYACSSDCSGSVSGSITVTATYTFTSPCNINPNAGNGEYNVEWCDYTGGNVGNAIATNTWLVGPDVNFQWGTNNVDNTGRNHDVFATAVGSFSFSYSGPWTLTMQHDDGLRVFVDGGEVYDNWSFITGSDSITVPISAGTHTIFIQYYAAGPPNLLVLTFAPPVTVTQTATTTSTSTTSTLTSATSTSGTTTTTTITSTSTSVSGYACVVSTTTSTSVRVSQQIATVTSLTTSTATTTTSTTGTEIVTTTSFTSTLTQTIVTVTTTSACTLSLTSTSTTTTSSTTTQPGHVVIAIQLQPGWDLISMPVVPLSTSITGVLKSQIASGKVVSVWSFQGNPPSWRSFIPGTGGSLTTMSDGYGYWVYMRTGDTLYVDGYVIVPGSTPPTYSLVQGWNMVGFKPQPTVQSETVGQYLSSISGKYDSNNVWVYTSTGWIRADPSYTLQPGQGMWILMTVPATLRP